MKRVPARPCPTPHKHAHRNQDEAEGHAKSQVRADNLDGRVSGPIYGYRCVCLRWHVTRDERGPQGQQNVVLVDWAPELQEWAIHG